MRPRQLAAAMLPLGREERKALWDAYPELHEYRDLIRAHIQNWQELEKHAASRIERGLS